MKLLMIVGNADDIFIYNMAKWLKNKMDVTIDVIEYNDSNTRPKAYDYNYYNKVETIPQYYLFRNVPFIRRYTIKYLLDWTRCNQLKKMLNGRHYDIIQCHYVLGMYAGAKYLKNYCDRLFFTFWGGEIVRERYLGSNFLFRKKITEILCNDSDGIINGSKRILDKLSITKNNPTVFHGEFGSTLLDYIYERNQIEKKNSHKRYWGIDVDKFVVQIGYTGRKSNRHLEMIQEFCNHDGLRKKIHLVAPMTRGRDENYSKKVQCALEKSGYSYTFIDKHLNDEELAELRCSSDVVLQLTELDGYSRSIIEILCSGAILIYGDWLGYNTKFKKDGFEGLPVKSISDAVDLVGEVINNIDKYNKITENNIEKGKNQHLWPECIKDWVAVYKGEASPMN